MAHGATRQGNVPIYGDTGIDIDQMIVIDTIVGEDAEKLLFFFNEEMNTDAEKHELELNFTKDLPSIRIKARESERRVAIADIDRWKSLLSDKIYNKTISGYVENTFNNVKAIIKACKLEVKVLPIQSKPKSTVVRIYAKDMSHLYNVKHAYENPQNPLADKPSSTPDVSITRPKSRQTTRPEDRSTGSFKQIDNDVKFEFTTKEGLIVKLYKKQITRLNVDAIVNAANDTLANIGGVAEVIEGAAGYQMNRECKDIVRRKGKVWEGSNVVTSAGDMENYKGVIHAVGPRWSDHYDKAKCLRILEDTIIHILETAKQNRFKSVAMPPISSGIFGVPKQMCAAMYLKGILEFSYLYDIGSLREFHIIDIHDDVLDMVVDWYQQLQRDPKCLEYNTVLQTVPLNRKEGRIVYPHHHGQANNMRQKSDGSTSGNFSENRIVYPYPHGQTDNHGRNPVWRASGNFSGSKKGNDKVKSTGKIFELKKFCGKTDIYIYSKDALELIGIDVIAVSEDGMVTGSGALSRALLDAGDKKYRKEHGKLQPWVWKHSSAQVMLTSGGDNLPFHHVIHAVIRRSGENEDAFQKKLQDTITKVLENADRLYIKKKRTPGIKIALPVMGIGTQRDDDTLDKCCWTTTEAIKKYLQTTRFVRITQIHLINLNETITKMLQDCFTFKPPYRPPPPTTKPDFTRPHNKQQYDPQKYLKNKIQTWKMGRKAQGSTDVSKFMKSHSQPKPAGNLPIYGLEPEEEEVENCVVCLCELEDPVELIDCKHVFCKECIMEVFGSKPSCPVCGMVYGVVYGDQPRDGVAEVYEDDESLPGYDKKKTYVICYDFPAGKQEEFHPEPGKPYDGMKRRGFLPKNGEGTVVLGLLRKAFQQGLTFTIGTSRTTGKEGVLTWNDIHHKTSRAGGPQKFGYPDPDYLSRVKEELSCKGITAEK